eukprot:1134319-Pelagomonas_calceolata.AAC.1
MARSKTSLGHSALQACLNSVKSSFLYYLVNIFKTAHQPASNLLEALVTPGQPHLTFAHCTCLVLGAEAA